MATGTKFFRGLNNVTDSLRLGMSWLVQADNVDVTVTGAIRKRAGYVKTFSGALTGSYSTLDNQRLYVVDGGVLKAMAEASAAVALQTCTSNAPMHFTEVNGQIFYNNGIDSGIVNADNAVSEWAWPTPDTVAVAAVTGSLPAGTYQVRCTFALPSGRESGSSESVELALGEGSALQVSNIPLLPGHFTNVYIAPADSTVFQRAFTSIGAQAFVWNSSPDQLGTDLQNLFMSPLPQGTDIIEHWRGRIYAAQYLAESDQTAVWFSQPLGYHLFNLNSDFLMIPGRVLMLAPHDTALLIGTERAVHAYDGKSLTTLAPYGVVPGWHWSIDEDDRQILFWTVRGLCKAMPFANLTDRQISVAPGLSAGGALVRQHGTKRFLVSLQAGGAPFNPLT